MAARAPAALAAWLDNRAPWRRNQRPNAPRVFQLAFRLADQPDGSRGRPRLSLEKTSSESRGGLRLTAGSMQAETAEHLAGLPRRVRRRLSPCHAGARALHCASRTGGGPPADTLEPERKPRPSGPPSSSLLPLPTQPTTLSIPNHITTHTHHTGLVAGASSLLSSSRRMRTLLRVSPGLIN